MRGRWLDWRVLGGALAMALSTACASSNALSAAERGDLTQLRHAIDEERTDGTLDSDDARDIARAVAAQQIVHSKGTVGLSTLRAYRACARPLKDAYERRSASTDRGAAEATLIRLELGLTSPDDFTRFADAEDAAWRAVGARALIGPELGESRRRLVLDGDQGVRLAALRAAADEADPADRDLVLDGARRDPLPLARTVAIRAAGQIGGEAVVLALKDLWGHADLADREAIASAWAQPASLDAGGRRELLWAAQSTSGSPAIAAAVELARLGGAGAAEARGVLARAIREGSSSERLFAIGAAPSSPEVLEALQEVKGDDDRDVALAALRRLAGTRTGKERAAALAAMKKLTTIDDERFAARARGALADSGDGSVADELETGLDSHDAETRRVSARGLVSLGLLERAVRLVADDDPSVRHTVACHIIGARSPR